MRWPWSKRAPRPRIPPYQPPVEVPAERRLKPKEAGIEVQEVDTSQMTQTGVYKAWKRLTGRRDDTN